MLNAIINAGMDVLPDFGETIDGRHCYGSNRMNTLPDGV